MSGFIKYYIKYHGLNMQEMTRSSKEWTQGNYLLISAMVCSKVYKLLYFNYLYKEKNEGIHSSKRWYICCWKIYVVGLAKIQCLCYERLWNEDETIDGDQLEEEEEEKENGNIRENLREIIHVSI